MKGKFESALKLLELISSETDLDESDKSIDFLNLFLDNASTKVDEIDDKIGSIENNFNELVSYLY